MLIWEILIVALRAIRANALRSILTALGIVIGVGAVIAMVALGAGAAQQVEDEIAKRGTNTLNIRGGAKNWWGVAEGEEPLTTADAEALEYEAGDYLTVAPSVNQRNLQVTYQRWNTAAQIEGTWPTYQEVNNYEVLVGDFFDQGHVQGRRRVAVLGFDIPERLKTPAVLLLGKTIQIKGIPFEVIGVMEQKGEMSSGWFRPDQYIYIPLTTGQHRVFGGNRREELGGITVQAATTEELDRAYGDIDRVLRRQHRIGPGEDADFQINSAVSFLEAQQENRRTFTVLLMGIAAVSLLVGGIGIMNIMMVSVTERTREIGVRKALGATRGNILHQFLIEALVLCILGGILGVAAGIGGAAAMTHYAEWRTEISMNALALALGFSAMVGLFFGIWPAQRAAKMDPIDSLRYE